MELGIEQLPASIQAGRAQLFADGIYFVPIRHHSPACAFALQALIREIRPEAILIEGPDSFSSLIDLLNHEVTLPPVAILAQSRLLPCHEEDEKTQPETSSAFFPLCEYSPEWIALRVGKEVGAQLAFIDLPWEEKQAHTHDQQADSLQAERYLAHSRWLQSLARTAGCRDHHELWDHLFELRPQDELANWRPFLSDVFCWCAMARLEYEQEVLEAENSLPRERHMASWIRHWRDQVKGPIVVVSGGFHTAELLNWSTAARRKTGKPSNSDKQWLIRYGFEQLDALNNYAAGMPSPAYYQRVWEAMNDPAIANPWQSASGEMLMQLARQTRDLNLAETLSTADVQTALLQALRLADLRGHAGPGRTDLLDALTSCFIKRAVDDGYSGLLGDARKMLAGSRLGNIPASAGSPPLLEDARRLARAHSLRLEDSDSRNSKLDLYRKPAHRARSHFFHLMDFLGTGLARKLGGPDFLAGTRLDMLFEEWSYAWTPTVEARLIDLSAQGASLHAVALVRLRQQELILEEQGRARSASQAVQLLTRACLIGMHQRLPDLFLLLETHLQEDAVFASVVTCAHQLLALWQAREPLGIQGNQEVCRLLAKVWPAALYLLPTLAQSKAEEEAETIRQLLVLREAGKRLASMELAQQVGADTRLLTEYLQALLLQENCAPGIEAAAAAILYLDDVWQSQQLAELLARRFACGASAELAARFLNGLLNTAPELPLHEPSVLAVCNQCLTRWEEADFIAFLPDLRHAFTHLNPQETDRLAQAVGELNGSDKFTVQYHQEASTQDLEEGLDLQRRLHAALQADGLDTWLQEASQFLQNESKA